MNITFPKIFVQSLLASSASLVIITGAFAKDVEISHYTLSTTQATVEQRDLMAVVIDVDFPDHIHTVGHAIKSLLAVHGFKIGAVPAGSFSQAVLYQLPLPEVHRHLGPISLHTALTILGGESFSVQVNPVTREVSYQLHDTLYHWVSTPEVVRAKKQWESFIETEEKDISKSKNLVTHQDDFYGPVKQDDTLSRIALALKPSDVTIEQAMMSIFDHNPDAFSLNNINYLNLHASLKIPTLEDMRKPRYRASKARVLQHHQQWLDAQAAK